MGKASVKMVCISDISDENDGHGRTITKEELESRTGVMCWEVCCNCTLCNMWSMITDAVK